MIKSNRNFFVATAFVALGLFSQGAFASGASFFDDMLTEDTGLWKRADGLSNSPANVMWRSDHIFFIGTNNGAHGGFAARLNTAPCAWSIENCMGRQYAAGEFISNDTYGHGTYSALMQGAVGNGVVTEFTANGGLFGARILGAAPYQIQVGYFGADATSSDSGMVNLGYSLTSSQNLVSFTWGQGSFSASVNGQQVWTNNVMSAAANGAATDGTIQAGIWASDAAHADNFGVYDRAPKTVAFDNIGFQATTVVPAVPEPGETAMLLAGLGMIGAGALRKKSRG